MAIKIDHMLEPDEQVVYRAGRAHGRVILPGYALFTAAVICWAAVAWSLDNWTAGSALLFGGLALLVFLLAHGVLAAAIVTDRRVLYHGGFPNGRMVEVSLPRLTGVREVGQWGTVVRLRDADGKTIRLRNLPGTKRVAAEIREQAGLPAREPVPRRLWIWAKLAGGMVDCGVTASLALMLLAAYLAGPRPESMEPYAVIAVYLAVIAAGFFLAVNGSIAGMYLAILVLRFVLPAADIRRLFGPAGDEEFLAHFDFLPQDWGAPMRRFASRLYGQRI